MHAFDRRTEFSSLDRVCIAYSAVKTRHCMQTIIAQCCVVFCTNDWRYKDEYRERTVFSSVSCGQETKERVDRLLSTANLLNSFATQNQHCLQPWLYADTRRTILLTSPPPPYCNSQGRCCRLAAGNSGTISNSSSRSSSSSSNCCLFCYCSSSGCGSSIVVVTVVVVIVQQLTTTTMINRLVA